MGKIKSIAVYLGATMPANPIYVDAVRTLGIALVARGIALVFGGSREGTMTVLADTVLLNGGKAIGVFTKSLPQNLLYQGLTETIITENLAERKATMLALADAVIGLPGSFGTWDEFFDALEQAKIDLINRKKPKPVGLLNINGFYDGVQMLFGKSVEEGFTSARTAKLLLIRDTVDDLLEALSLSVSK